MLKFSVRVGTTVQYEGFEGYEYEGYEGTPAPLGGALTLKLFIHRANETYLKFET